MIKGIERPIEIKYVKLVESFTDARYVMLDDERVGLLCEACDEPFVALPPVSEYEARLGCEVLKYKFSVFCPHCQTKHDVQVDKTQGDGDDGEGDERTDPRPRSRLGRKPDVLRPKRR